MGQRWSKELYHIDIRILIDCSACLPKKSLTGHDTHAKGRLQMGKMSKNDTGLVSQPKREILEGD
jgi:hypothetical protein